MTSNTIAPAVPIGTSPSAACPAHLSTQTHEITFMSGDKIVIEIPSNLNKLLEILAIKKGIEKEKGIKMWKQELIPSDDSGSVWICISIDLDYTFIDCVDTITVLYDGEQRELQFQKSLLDLCTLLYPPHLLRDDLYNDFKEFLLKKATKDLEIEEGFVFKCKKQQETGVWELVKTNELIAEKKSQERSTYLIIGLYEYSKTFI
jgi:hypothetical protein